MKSFAAWRLRWIGRTDRVMEAAEIGFVILLPLYFWLGVSIITSGRRSHKTRGAQSEQIKIKKLLRLSEIKKAGSPQARPFIFGFARIEKITAWRFAGRSRP
jgi:hypothetical protein